MAYEASQLSVIPARTNTLAPRGGLAFDGSANTRVYSTLTNQNIGTDAFSVSVVVEIPTSVTVDQGLVNLASHATVPANAANAFYVELKVAGNMVAYVQGASTSDVNNASVVGVVSAYGGKRVVLTFVRPASGNLAIYINGVAQSPTYGTTGTPPTWQGSITSTYLGLGYQNASQLWKTCIYSATLYNLALAQADVTEIVELGGAAPERFKFGTQTSRVPAGSVISLGAADADVSTAGNPNGNTWTRTAGARTGGAGAWFNRVSGSGYANWIHWSLASLASSPTHLVRFWARLNTGTSIGGLATSLAVQGGSVIGTSTRQAVTSSWAQYSHIVYAPNAKSMGIGMLYFDTQFSSPWEIDIDDVEIIPLGAVVHYDADLDGIGYQLHDQSTNKLDAILTTTGVTWTKPARRGYVRGTLSWSGSEHGPKSLLGQRALPVGALVDSVVLTPTVSSSGSGPAVGCTNSGNRWVGTAAMTANVREARVINQRIPAAAGDSNHDILIDPDSNNYGGSIQVEVQFSVTEGNP